MARRAGTAAPLTGLQVGFAEIAREHRLRVAHPPVAADRVEIPGRRQRKRAFEVRVELRLAGAHRVELRGVGALERTEEVNLVLDDRTAGAAAELVAAIVRFGRLEDPFRVERLVAEVLERGAANGVAARLGDRFDDAAGGEA